MKAKYFSLIAIFILFLLPLVYASCTITLDKTDYLAGETATSAMSCSEPGEKNTPYNVNWTNSSGYQFELDYGTTSAVKNQLFYQSFTIPTTWPNGIFLNVSLNGTGLAVLQNATANVTSTGFAASTLIITNSTFGGGFLGLVGSMQGIVKDENGKKITGGFCKISGWSNDETKMLLYHDTRMVNGEVKVSDILHPTRFDEATDYAYKIICYCGSDTSGTECIDEDGISVVDSIGFAKGFFTTSSWLEVNTVTGKSNYELKKEIFICANVTNVAYSNRIPLHINYQVRCSKGTDNNADLDRILIAYNTEEDSDIRGISTNTTQMQCRKFTIPEEQYLMGQTSECYASTNVWVLDDSHTELVGYFTTSPSFNITSDEINIELDWQWTSDTTINSIVNLSSFVDINGTGIGNIDVRLSFGQGFNIKNIFEISNILSNITVENLTDTLTQHTDYELEFLEDGYIELELRDRNLSQNWFNISFDFYDTELRSALALEGIENKTGTFHLDVACPSTGTIGTDMNCILTAYVEESQTMQKEIDFTCYISDGTYQYSSVNFNQMITKSAVSITRAFAVPSTFTDGTSYVLQCHADYYNLGSRRDSFYDTFTASTSPPKGGGSAAGITGGVVDEEEESGIDEIKKKIEDIIKKINPFNPETNPIIICIELIALIGIIVLLILFLRQKKKCAPHQKTISKINLRESFRIIFKSGFILIGISAGIALIAYIYKNIKPISLNTSFMQDPLIRDLILIGAIVGFTIILFKTLNIRGEIQFGNDPHRPKFNHDTHISRMQKKLNRLELKREIKRKKHPVRSPKIRKVRIKKKK